MAELIVRDERPTHDSNLGRLIRPREVATRYRVDLSTIYRWEEKNLFPKRRRFSAGVVGWFEHELKAWEESRPLSCA
jgi:predicted DNA-binding transcriptional regulator AlpA